MDVQTADRRQGQDISRDQLKALVFFQDAGKFNYRYSTLGFQDAAKLDDGDLWPVAYALRQWSPVVEKKVVKLVKAAAS